MNRSRRFNKHIKEEVEEKEEEEEFREHIWSRGFVRMPPRKVDMKKEHQEPRLNGRLIDLQQSEEEVDVSATCSRKKGEKQPLSAASEDDLVEQILQHAASEDTCDHFLGEKKEEDAISAASTTEWHPLRGTIADWHKDKGHGYIAPEDETEEYVFVGPAISGSSYLIEGDAVTYTKDAGLFPKATSCGGPWRSGPSWKKEKKEKKEEEEMPSVDTIIDIIGGKYDRIIEGKYEYPGCDQCGRMTRRLHNDACRGCKFNKYCTKCIWYPPAAVLEKGICAGCVFDLEELQGGFNDSDPRNLEVLNAALGDETFTTYAKEVHAMWSMAEERLAVKTKIEKNGRRLPTGGAQVSVKTPTGNTSRFAPATNARARRRSRSSCPPRNSWARRVPLTPPEETQADVLDFPLQKEEE